MQYFFFNTTAAFGGGIGVLFLNKSLGINTTAN
jgi:hypothetical protein